MTSSLIYTLCALTSLLCLALLWRGWRNTRANVLLWSAICFGLLTLTNLLLVLDRVVWAVEIDLRLARLATALLAVGVLLFGLIWGDD